MQISSELKKIPFLKITFPFLLGNIFQFNFNVPLILSSLLVSILFLITIVIHIKNRYSPSYDKYSIQLLSILLFMFFGGTMYVSINNKPNIKVVDNQNITYLAVINDNPVDKPNSIKAEIEIQRLFIDSIWHDTTILAIAYFSKKEMQKRPEYADIFFGNSNLQIIRNAGNPDEFDYALYMKRQGIYYQTYLSNDKWQKCSIKKSYSMVHLATLARNHLLYIYKSFGISGNELSVLAALTLGYKAELDNETKKAYTASGAMHILAVSGMHIGIVYIIFKWLFSLLRRNRQTLWLNALFLMLSIWGFAFLTGLSPSVQRAAFMFSFIILADALKKNSNIFNTMALSAFCMQLINPQSILSPGFQLSYIAVISIVLFYPKIEVLINPKNKILKNFWSITAVSIAAQIGTTPISIYYFHQFPNLFFITNIIVINVAVLVMYLALALFLFYAIPLLGKLLAMILKYSIWIMNQAVFRIESIPFSVSEGLNIHFIQLITLYVLLSILLIFLYNKKFKLLLTMVLMLCLYVTVSLFQNISRQQTQWCVIYNIKEETICDFVAGREHCIINLEQKDIETEKLEFAASNFWTKQQLKPPLVSINLFTKKDTTTVAKEIGLIQKKTLIHFNGINIAVPHSDDFEEKYSGIKFDTDYLIITPDFKHELSEALSFFKPKKIVLSPTNSKWRTENLIKDAKDFQIPCYNIKTEGAFIVKL